MSDVPFGGMPIGATPSYKAAVERTEGQCENLIKAKRMFDRPRRCTRTLAGGHRLYLTEDGRLLCATHFDLARRKAKSEQR